MKFYTPFSGNSYIIASPEPLKDYEQAGREIHPRDLPAGILGTAYDAGFSDGVAQGADGWQAAREQLVEERDTLAQKLERVNNDVHDKGMTIFALRDKVEAIAKERNNYREAWEREVDRVNRIASERNRLQETVEKLQEELSQEVIHFRNIFDKERDRQFNEALDRVVADRDRFQKLYTAELAKQSTGSTAYAEGLNNGRGYAYTEISNHCRELRSKLKGEY